MTKIPFERFAHSAMMKEARLYKHVQTKAGTTIATSTIIVAIIVVIIIVNYNHHHHHYKYSHHHCIHLTVVGRSSAV